MEATGSFTAAGHGAARKAGRLSIEAAEQLTHAILDAALSIFVERGFADTTIESIAERCDTTRRSIAHRFSTRECLLTEAVRRKLSFVVDDLLRFSTDAVGRDPRDTLRAAFRSALEYVIDSKFIGFFQLISHEGTRVPSVGRLSLEANDAVIRHYVRLILNAQESGHFCRYSASAVAQVGLAVMMSNPINRASLGDPAFLDREQVELYFSEMWAVFLTMA